MIVSKQELFTVLRQYNPWWEDGDVPDLPEHKRAAFKELRLWLAEPPARRAVLLSGARQVGKTTLLLQVIESLLDSRVRPATILYATLDHPLLKLVGVDRVLEAWREMQPRSEGVEYLLLDEIQYAADWQTWLKHQVDFQKGRRIAVTGSAVPLISESPESGVGRWHTIRLPTLSFFEYLRIKGIEPPALDPVESLTELFSWSLADRVRATEAGRALVPYFHEYLLRGGFPQTALMDNLSLAQKLLREDIVDRVLKRDMTSLYGVRRVLELEKTFLYLCLHDGGILNIASLCANLELKKGSVNSFLDLLEAAHLIYRLPPSGYGKEVLRGRHKVYLADAAIAGSVLMRGRSLLEDTTRLGAAVETACFKHVFIRYYDATMRLCYWRNPQGHEVDIVAEMPEGLVPFEVKYTQGKVAPSDLTGLRVLCQNKKVPQAYVFTRDIADFEVVTTTGEPTSSAGTPEETAVLKLPAPLACYWLPKPEAD